MKRFVYNQKYARLLVSMQGVTSQIDELARKINANSGHLRIVLEQWHKESVISKDKPGRDYQIKLTPKGEAIALKLGELMNLVDNWDRIKENEVLESEGMISDKPFNETLPGYQKEVKNKKTKKPNEEKK